MPKVKTKAKDLRIGVIKIINSAEFQKFGKILQKKFPFLQHSETEAGNNRTKWSSRISKTTFHLTKQNETIAMGYEALKLDHTNMQKDFIFFIKSICNK